MKLQSTTDLSLEKNEFGLFKYNVDVLRNNSKFLKQPLELWMFVPCKLMDGVWLVLEEPKEYQKWLKAIDINEFNYWAEGWDGCAEYQEAKERVLFENSSIKEIKEWNCYMVKFNGVGLFRFSKNRKILEVNEPKCVEDLIKLNLTLTESSIKQIVL